MFSRLAKPEYLFQPRMLVRRLLGRRRGDKPEFDDWRLPWGLTIRIRPAEEHGRMLQTLGVVDLEVSETLWRLCEPGETNVDVGGNIGYMTSLLSCRTAKKAGGRLLTFEAHPGVFGELTHNIGCWASVFPGLDLKAVHAAISDREGTLNLKMPEGFRENRGLSQVVDSGDSGGLPDNCLEVQAKTLDGVLGAEDSIGLLKVDVEGHELQVLNGATNLLEQGRVRDCVFEEHRDFPTPVTDCLQSHGYEVFRLHRTLWGPVLLDGGTRVERSAWLPTSFLATLDSSRAKALFRPGGWQVLKSRRLLQRS